MTNRNDSVMDTQLLDLSLGGMRLAASDGLVDHIQAEDKNGKRVFPEEFRVDFTLPLDAETVAIGLQCRLVYKRRLSQHDYQIGLKILAYEGASEERLRRYIASRLP